jgi:hypothetical protein
LLLFIHFSFILSLHILPFYSFFLPSVIVSPSNSAISAHSAGMITPDLLVACCRIRHHHHNTLKDLGLMACSDLIFTDPIVFSVDVPSFFSLMVGSSG